MRNVPSRMVGLGAVAAILLTAAAGRADDKAASCPMHEQHMKQAEESHADAVKRRGDKGMGFSQERTVHHFRLLPDGGSIEVAVADAADAESKEQIQHHLAHIAGAFASGDFALPMLIHAQTPPGVPAMRRLKAKISYAYEATPAGGRVRIATKDPQAVAAVHAFLRFQISDHQTGDPTTIQPR